MSDETNQADADFRGNRETKRRDETVMLGQESVSAMVSEAKAAPAGAATAVADDEPSGTRMIILAAGAIVILLVVVALVYSLVS